MKCRVYKKSNTAFMTTVFPGCMIYFDAFIESLLLQTDKDFDLLIINDGVVNLVDYIEKYKEINFLQIFSCNTIVQNRKLGIDTAINLNYKYLIFGDSDDYFAPNRISISKHYLKNFDIVVNDLSLFNIKHGIYKEKCFSKRLTNNSIISSKYIEDKNIFGLSNSAVKVSEIHKIIFCKNLIAFDWYLFSQLLYRNKTAVFTNETQTYYRQYENNTVGLGVNSIESIKNSIQVKKIHYECMSKTDTNLDKFLLQIKFLEKKIDKGDINLDEYKHNDLLWWENTNYIINN